MSTAVEINGLTLVPIKEAASRVSYTRDYVARLAREGKIVASQVGRQWFVDITSLENFSAEANALEEARRQELRAERKRELMAKEALSVLDEHVMQRMTKQRFDASLVTAAVVCIGLFTGVGLYTMAHVPGSPLQNLSDSLAIVSIPVRVPSEQPGAVAAILPEANEERSTLLLSTVVEQPIFTTESETEKISNGLQGVLVLAEGSETPSKAAVAKMFSDNVAVTFSEENAGVITYQDNETVKQYPFVLVPNTDNGVKGSTP